MIHFKLFCAAAQLTSVHFLELQRLVYTLTEELLDLIMIGGMVNTLAPAHIMPTDVWEIALQLVVLL
jgi:hypothetical protein